MSFFLFQVYYQTIILMNNLKDINIEQLNLILDIGFLSMSTEYTNRI